MEQIAAPPTRRELIRFGVWVALVLCVLALVGLRQPLATPQRPPSQKVTELNP
jgi:hypothetical protein